VQLIGNSFSVEFLARSATFSIEPLTLSARQVRLIDGDRSDIRTRLKSVITGFGQKSF